MSWTKYQELRQLSSENQRRFAEYKSECMRFRSELVAGLADYLQCPEEKIVCPRLPGNENEIKAQGILEFLLNERMALYDDGSYGFPLGIHLHRERVEFLVKVKKDGPEFVAQFDNKEWKIDERLKEGLDVFIEYLYNAVKTYLETKFEDFVSGKPSGLGFLRDRPFQQGE